MDTLSEINLMDEWMDGHVELHGTSIESMSFVCSKVKDVFNTIDTSGSGRLSCHDVRSLLHFSVTLSLSPPEFPICRTPVVLTALVYSTCMHIQLQQHDKYILY